jgi:xanthine dehydrogenase YagT iron-sulfur-binding subunit
MTTSAVDSLGSESVERARVPDVGCEAPDFELTDHAGRRRRLSELRGSPVLLAFHPAHWDPSWAEYVRAYNRAISTSAESNGARLLSVVGVGAWQTLAFDDASLDFPAACIDLGPIAAQYGVSEGPAVFVIDPEGRVSWRHVSPDALPSPNDVADALAASLTVETYDEPHRVWSRRQFVATTLAVTLAIALTRRIARAEPVPAPARPASLGPADSVKLRVNGRDLSLELEPRVTLLDALREYAGITGPKKGCDHGQCGACTVHVNGRRVLSCLTFAVMQRGKEITTIEGLAATAGATGDALHPMQQAFIDHDGFQCGYCTSGQIMSAAAMVREPWGPTDDDVRVAMSGNICRCGAYPGIVAAIQSVRKRSATDQGGRR